MIICMEIYQLLYDKRSRESPLNMMKLTCKNLDEIQSILIKKKKGKYFSLRILRSSMFLVKELLVKST